MKQTAIWHQPLTADPHDFGHLGYVLFRSSAEEGRILHARVADPTVTKGENFWKRLGLSRKEITCLHETLSRGGACWLVSALGVGILCGRYDLWLGTYLYIHFHDDPKALRRLIYYECPDLDGVAASPLGGMRTRKRPDEWDEPVRRRLTEACALLNTLRETSLRKVNGAALTLGDLWHFLTVLPAFVGVPASFHPEASFELLGKGAKWQREEDTVIDCPAPYLWEASLLYWLGMLRETADGREIQCGISISEAEDHPCVGVILQVVTDIRFLTNTASDQGLRLSEIEEIRGLQELNGVQVSITCDPMPDREGTLAGEMPVLLSVSLLFSKHPARQPLPWLKTKPTLDYSSSDEPLSPTNE
ncbi:MAG: hypothetical protein E7661_08540 [Ruminococcaceae bacterium]|nr:hypothetical protein [Oscillospiraceae bacterium]